MIAGAVALLALALQGEARTSSANPWLGSWSLDRAHSHLVGPSIRIGRASQGYSFDFGAISFVVGDDGRDYPTIPGHTTSIRPFGPRRWLRVHKSEGGEVDRSLLELSPDNRLLHISTTRSAAPGQSDSSVETLRRIGPGVGLAGRWRSETAGANVTARFVLSDAGKGRWRLDDPDERQAYVFRPGGDAAEGRGEGAVAGVTLRFSLTAPATARWTEFLNDKPYRLGRDRLIGARLLEETSWPATDPSERQVAVYQRR